MPHLQVLHQPHPIPVQAPEQEPNPQTSTASPASNDDLELDEQAAIEKKLTRNKKFKN